MGPTNFNYIARGKVRIKTGDKKGAIVDFTKAIELNPTFFGGFYWRGFARYQLGDKKKALIDLNLALRFNKIAENRMIILKLIREIK